MNKNKCDICYNYKFVAKMRDMILINPYNC